jgi:hypothetical protein
MSQLTRVPLAFNASRYIEVKDPCPVFDGRRWQLFGTGVTGPHTFELLRATADNLSGPWSLEDPVSLQGISGGCVGAPGVIAENGVLHMFVQTEYNRTGGTIEHLVSGDSGQSFQRRPTALVSDPDGGEAGVYDPHPAVIAGERLLVYSAFNVVGQPDLHLARSDGNSWDGPWRRLGPILIHEHVPWHNQHGDDAYEWGLEGAQLVALPDGRTLLNAVGFVHGGAAGSRQRVFLAVAANPYVPFDVGPPVVMPLGGETTGENGHATVVIDGDELVLFFQERDAPSHKWRYALATAPLHSYDNIDISGRVA